MKAPVQIETGHRKRSRISPSVTGVRSRRWTKEILPRSLTFSFLFFLWLILSGQYDLFHITLGIISCLIVTWFSGDLLFADSKATGLFRHGLRMLGYFPWLLYQIFLANLHILYIVCHPRMMELIDPRIIRFQSRLTHELPLVILANSITLTPGTITVYVSVDGDFQVHAIDQKSGDPLPGEMEGRISRALEE